MIVADLVRELLLCDQDLPIFLAGYDCRYDEPYLDDPEISEEPIIASASGAVNVQDYHHKRPATGKAIIIR